MWPERTVTEQSSTTIKNNDMKKYGNKKVKAAVQIESQTYTVEISQERAEQIRRLQGLIKDGRKQKK